VIAEAMASMAPYLTFATQHIELCHVSHYLVIMFALPLYRLMHWVSADSFTGSLYWTVRSWLWNHPVTSDFGIWDQGDPNEQEKWVEERTRILHIWKFLEPFFVERGYTLYIQKDLTNVFALQCPASKMIDPERSLYPYGQYCCKDDEELGFSSGVGNMKISRFLMLIFLLRQLVCGPPVIRTEGMW
jgi:hypothetical protein